MDDPSGVNIAGVQKVEAVASNLDGKHVLPSTVAESQG